MGDQPGTNEARTEPTTTGSDALRAQAARAATAAELETVEPGRGHDDLQRLWTPWRLAYIRNTGGVTAGCPFCRLPGRGVEHDAQSLIVHRGQTAYVILNAYPYNPGHLLVVPYRHTDDYGALTGVEVHELADLGQRCVRILRDTSGAQAFNLGMNLGAAGGAGIADHVHQHVVPRWTGDTNFMPVIGQTRVLPELLAETFARIAPAFVDG